MSIRTRESKPQSANDCEVHLLRDLKALETDNIRLLIGRTALVTGGTSGIGFHTALGLARIGAVVYVTGRNLSCG